MRLSKSDALFLHTVLWHYRMTSQGNFSYTEEDKLNSLVDELSKFVLSVDEDENQEDGYLVPYDDEEEADEDLEDEDDSEADADEEEITSFVSPADLAALPTITVISPTGSKVTLEFEDVNEELCVDALLDNGSVIIDSVESLRLTSDAVELYDGEEWHSFTSKKIPKKWLSLIDLDTVYGVKADSAEEDE